MTLQVVFKLWANDKLNQALNTMKHLFLCRYYSFHWLANQPTDYEEYLSVYPPINKLMQDTNISCYLNQECTADWQEES